MLGPYQEIQICIELEAWVDLGTYDDAPGCDVVVSECFK